MPGPFREFELLVVLGMRLAVLMDALDQFIVFTALTAKNDDGALTSVGRSRRGTLVRAPQGGDSARAKGDLLLKALV